MEPLTLTVLERIIEKEKPGQPSCPTLGGQTGLNLAMQLARSGFLEKHGVTPAGRRARRPSTRAEDRQLFKDTMETHRASR